jgi:hypothetical protein
MFWRSSSIISMCSLHVILLSKITPRYFTSAVNANWSSLYSLGRTARKTPLPQFFYCCVCNCCCDHGTVTDRSLATAVSAGFHNSCFEQICHTIMKTCIISSIFLCDSSPRVSFYFPHHVSTRSGVLPAECYTTVPGLHLEDILPPTPNADTYDAINSLTWHIFKQSVQKTSGYFILLYRAGLRSAPRQMLG